MRHVDVRHTDAMNLRLLCADITTRRVDAIVNAANASLLGGSGVDGAIHAAGGPDILAECRGLRAGPLSGGLPTGQAVATTAGDLSARWVIHTVGPVYNPDNDQWDLLRSAYVSSLRVADGLGARSVAFPLISAGAYGWPKRDAIRQALIALTTADTAVSQVELVLFDATTLEMAQEIRANF